MSNMFAALITVHTKDLKLNGLVKFIDEFRSHSEQPWPIYLFHSENLKEINKLEYNNLFKIPIPLYDFPEDFLFWSITQKYRHTHPNIQNLLVFNNFVKFKNKGFEKWLRTQDFVGASLETTTYRLLEDTYLLPNQVFYNPRFFFIKRDKVFDILDKKLENYKLTEIRGIEIDGNECELSDIYEIDFWSWFGYGLDLFKPIKNNVINKFFNI